MTIIKLQRLKEEIGSQINCLKRIRKRTIGNRKKKKKTHTHTHTHTFLKFIPGLWLA